MAQAADTSLAGLRLALAPAIARAAVFDGWSDAARDAAALEHGTDPALAKLAFPGGAMDMIAAFVESVDAAMREHFADGTLDTMKIRQRIRALVWFRLDHLRGLEEAISRALAIQAMPQNVARSLKLGWASADAMWRLAGDTATDYNHYTKRAILSALYGSTLLVWLGDNSEGAAETAAFLDRRIDEVMRFERWKAGIGKAERPSLTRFLGWLRYPPR